MCNGHIIIPGARMENAKYLVRVEKTAQVLPSSPREGRLDRDTGTSLGQGSPVVRCLHEIPGLDMHKSMTSLGGPVFDGSPPPRLHQPCTQSGVGSGDSFPRKPAGKSWQLAVVSSEGPLAEISRMVGKEIPRKRRPHSNPSRRGEGGYKGLKNYVAGSGFQKPCKIAPLPLLSLPPGRSSAGFSPSAFSPQMQNLQCLPNGGHMLCLSRASSRK